MSGIQSYPDLKVWKLGMQWARECFQQARSFPREEMFGMTSQIRRAATSVPANIEEGTGRDNRCDYIHFLRIAQGSLKELETHLMLSTDVNISKSPDVQPILDLCDRLGRMLRSMIHKLQTSE